MGGSTRTEYTVKGKMITMEGTYVASELHLRESIINRVERPLGGVGSSQKYSVITTISLG